MDLGQIWWLYFSHKIPKFKVKNADIFFCFGTQGENQWQE
jgi:hypothetical protein